MAMKRGGAREGDKRRILPRRGFAVKGVMAQKFPEGMRPNEGRKNGNKPFWPAEGQ